MIKTILEHQHCIAYKISDRLNLTQWTIKTKLIKITCWLQGGYGQYSWSIMRGLSTWFMKMSSYIKLETLPIPGEAQVLILTPLELLWNMQFLTLISVTSFWSPSLPGLPILILCSGPQTIFVILKFSHLNTTKWVFLLLIDLRWWTHELMTNRESVLWYCVQNFECYRFLG